MKVNFTVLSAHTTPMQMTAEINGKEMPVTVDGFVAELQSEDGTMCHTIRVNPEDMEDAQAIFILGAGVTVEYAVNDAQPAPAPVERPADPLADATMEEAAAHQTALEAAIEQHGQVDITTLQPPVDSDSDSAPAPASVVSDSSEAAPPSDPS